MSLGQDAVFSVALWAVQLSTSSSELMKLPLPLQSTQSLTPLSDSV